MEKKQIRLTAELQSIETDVEEIMDEICLVFYENANPVHVGMHTESGRISSIP